MPLGRAQQIVQDLFERLLADRLPATVAIRLAQAGVQQAKIIVDFGDGGHRAAGVLTARALIDGNRRLEALDQVHVGPFELVEELSGVGREAFDILPLSLGI